ncbi:unnamed protein product [Malus baccata var. baccata]
MGNKLCTGEKFGSKIYTGKKLGGKVFTGKYIKGRHISSVKNKKLEHAVDIGDDPSFVCDLCEAKIHLGSSFNIKGCAHFYCQECVVQYVVSNLQNNVTSTIMCPVQGCTGVLDPDYCRPILPDDVFDGWGNALCESALVDESDDIGSTFVCDFCVERVDLKDSFNIKGCSHFYCQYCIVKFVASKLDDNVSSIICPAQGCTGSLDLDYCRPILPTDVFDRWGKAICESVVIGPQKKNHLYCPFATCSALLIHEGPEDTNQAWCPHCKREFCAKCKVPWHTEFNCAMFQKLRDKGEDKMLKELAQNKNWRRCPRCNYYVERIDGCSYMKCRWLDTGN